MLCDKCLSWIKWTISFQVSNRKPRRKSATSTVKPFVMPAIAAAQAYERPHFGGNTNPRCPRQPLLSQFDPMDVSHILSF
ncbi:hypothetical protein PsorP6_016562 [Peronosclerospora sorghi]|uniref:Uncharacterized protein n=1 Tax=Peronosclerospora sorghi TaxID=230839 RepID=A0ACC0VLQ2_9STRA|nr:hypothetical protein PsorP6_016562 [Peronosclerospora sorghi]